MKPLLLLATFLALAGCTEAQQRLAAQAGQLYCAVRTVTGPVVVGLINAEASAAGYGSVAVLATGASKAAVDALCKSAGGVAVSPPADPASAPQVAVAVTG